MMDPFASLNEIEIDWCEEHPEVPQAAAALAAHRAKMRDPDNGPLVRTYLAAVADLRTIRPRPPGTIDRFYAYVNPCSPYGGEDGLAIDDGHGLLFLVAADRARLAVFNRYVPTIEEQLGHKLDLYRFNRQRNLTANDVARMMPEPGPPMVSRIWAMVHRLDTGDEAVSISPLQPPGTMPAAMLFTTRRQVLQRRNEIIALLTTMPGVEFRAFGDRQPMERPA